MSMVVMIRMRGWLKHIIWLFPILFMHGSLLSSVDVSIPDQSGAQGSTINIPVNVSNGGNDIYSFLMKITFSSSVLEAKSVSAGPVLSLWGSPTTNIQPGEITIAGAGSSPLSESGELINISFEVKGSPGDTTTIHLEEVTFNEGSPVATTDDGEFTVIDGSGPVLQVSPDNLNFTAIEGGSNPSSQTLTVTNGGSGTLTWSASSSQSWLSLKPSSGTAPSTVTVSIDISGLSVGTFAGTVTVTAAGAGGSPKNVPVTLEIHSVSGIIVSIPDSWGPSGSELEIPVNVTDVTGEGIYSFLMRLTYDSGILEATGTSVTETISSDWGSPTINITPGQIAIAMAGSDPLRGSGVLVVVRFQAKGSTGDRTTIQFAEMTFNEGSPVATTDDGDFTTDVNSHRLRPIHFSLSQNVPNPFNATTRFRYTIPMKSDVSLEVYDAIGNRVRTLVNCRQLEGVYEIQWDGLNDTGKAVSSGVYFYRLRAGTFHQLKKMILVK